MILRFGIRSERTILHYSRLSFCAKRSRTHWDIRVWIFLLSFWGPDWVEFLLLMVWTISNELETCTTIKNGQDLEIYGCGFWKSVQHW